MTENQCGATSVLGDGTPAKCTLPITHTGNHNDDSLLWNWRAADNRCRALTFVSEEFGMVGCWLAKGHVGDHIENDTGRALCWPDVGPTPDPQPVTDRSTRHYGSNDLAGVNRDDLTHNLFKRVEQLEQSSADAAATDDMFLTLNRTVDHLESYLGEVERRMTVLEGLVSGTDLNRQFERLNGAICTVNGEAQERYVDVSAKLDSIWRVLAVMAPIIDSLKPAPLKVICGAPDLNGHYVCERDPGHDGRHGGSIYSWSATPAPDPAERASGSPVQCPTQFREGQCLGWAGHDGECSAVTGSGNPQLEDPDDYPEQNFHS